ncbi:MAG TPA: hypothetical protein VIA18_21180 [Polyangia bacterium]|nr:hypothetical protein [Polyangia bacterium]
MRGGGEDIVVDIVVIGRLADADVAREWPGHTILPRDGWSLARNHCFVRELVARRRRVYVGSPIARATLVDDHGRLTLFAFELAALAAAGFVQRGPLLLPPPHDPVAAALAADPVGFYRALRQRAAADDSRLPELAPTLLHAADWIEDAHASLAAELRAIAANGAPYAAALAAAHAFARAVDDEARAADPSLPRIYQPKVAAELAPLVALYPDVIAFPTFAPLSPGFFVQTRVAPVHPLGLRTTPLFSDGAVLSPLEYFLHDVDHARFMVREELLSRGVALPDAYQSPPDGGAPTTLVDAATHRHRTILDGAQAAVTAAALDDRAILSRRSDCARRLAAAATSLARADADAVELLLFEMLHEKGLPFEPRVLRREAAGTRHVDKLRHKLTSGFYGDSLPHAGRGESLPAARQWLLRELA